MLLWDHEMVFHYNYSLEYLDNLTPLERNIHIDLVKKWIREENERIAEKNKRT